MSTTIRITARRPAATRLAALLCGANS